MAGFNDHEAGDKLDAGVDNGNLVAKAFDYTEEVESPFMESQFVNLDAETEELGDKLDASVEDGHLVANAFDYTEEVESPFMESQFVNLDAETEELDIPHLVGDLRALVVDDSEDEIVLDSDDEVISEQKDRKIRGKPMEILQLCKYLIQGRLWRRVSGVGIHSFEVRSSAGSNLTDKNGPTSVHADTHNQDVLTGKSQETILISNNENVAIINQDQDNIEKTNEADNESEEPGESSQAKALSFVDHYLSISVVNSSPEASIPKIHGIRSPLASCAKGSRNLAKKVDLLTKIGISTFDWDGNQPDHEGEFVFRKKKKLDIEREELLDERCEDELNKSVFVNSKTRISRTDSVNSSDEQFDVSFNTQMAAEAMESLLFATPFDNLTNIQDASLKIVTQNKQKEYSDSEKENLRGGYRHNESFGKVHQKVQTFSPVACRTRHGSKAKHLKRTEDTCKCGYITCGKEDNILDKRKTGDLDTDFLLTSGLMRFDIWKWPKKRRTCRNTKHTANPTVVGPSETSGNFREAFSLSNVKRKARSASRFRSTAGNKLSKRSLIQKYGQPSLAYVTTTKCLSMSKPVGNEQKMQNSSFNKSSRKQNLDFISKDLRRRRSMGEIRVLFSQNLHDDVVKQQMKILKKLEICMAKDCSDATHVVADRFARTKKMLIAMAFGKPVVTPLWLESCEQARCVIDEKNYILRDFRKEKETGFSMPVSLSRARRNPLLKDRRVIITPNVEPNRDLIKNLVKAVHGQVVEGVRQASTKYTVSDNLLILSCEQDYETCIPFLDKDAAVYSSELLLNGIIIQKLEYTRHQLFTGHVKMLRYARKRSKSGS